MPAKRKASSFKLLEQNIPKILLAPFVLFVVILLGIAIIHASNTLFYKNEIFPKGVRYVPDEILVSYKKGSSPEELLADGRNQEHDQLIEALNKYGITSQKKLFSSNDEFLQNYYLFTLKKGLSIPDAYKNLVNIPEIEKASPNYILKIQDVTLNPAPNDPEYQSQWDLKLIDAQGAWNLLHTDGKATVAVIDTGVDYNHEDLVGRVIHGPNIVGNTQDPMDDHGHGTHVAGIIGAINNNGIGIAGTSWGAKIMAIKACNKDGDCTTTDIARGIKYAVDHGIKIINVSIAGAGSCDGTYTDILQYTKQKGILVVAAAGNGNNGDGVGVDVKTQIPAACDGVLAVGSVSPQDKRSPFSNYGSKVEIAAPGGVGPCSLSSCVLSSGINNGYMLRAGTSMAAPHVSAVAALLLSYNPSYNADSLKSCLIRSGDAVSSDKQIGVRLNARRAVLLCGVANANNVKITPSPTIRVAPYSIYGTVFIDSNNNGILDRNEKKLTGAQVVLSGYKSDSIISNNSGYYVFPSLSTGLFTISLSYNGESISIPEDVILTDKASSKRLDLPVSPGLLSTIPSITQQKTSSMECFPDPSCDTSKSSLQVCSFQCSYK